MTDEPWSELISIETIQEVHRECIARFGGDSTFKPTEGCIERSAGAAFNAELYTDNPDSIKGLCFAGCLLFYLIRNHCFVDGNKRVAWASCMEVLRFLGLTVDSTDSDAEEFVMTSLVVGPSSKLSKWHVGSRPD
jgi:death-on-curing protein